ncbi:TonB-dependent receptor [Thermithiobacillus plumbiphilus]|uniref:TonB-dependent receptor n=1 Tax=Thermithiobacillus plumbiphilus TaxID=1729899 RepID=A0ABU9D4V8_9PROT
METQLIKQFFCQSATISFILSALPLWVAHSQAHASEVTLEPVIVTATIENSAQRAANVEVDSANAMSVIGSKQLAQYGEQSLGDALRRVPGVTFDGANRAREVRLRGLPSQYTQVLINGRRLLDGNSRRTVELDRIPTGLVERVEVIRAPRASMDAQGVAGTINIVLKDGAQLPTQITVGAGHLESNGAQGEAGLVTGGARGALEYSLAFNAQRFRRSESKNVYEYDGDGAPTGATLNENQRHFDQVTFAPRLSLAVSDDTRLRFEPIYTRIQETWDDDIDTPLKADLVTHDRVTAERLERARQTYGIYTAVEHKLGDRSDFLVGLDAQRAKVDTDRDEVRFNTNSTINRERQRFELIEMTSLRPEAVLSLRRGDHAMRFGVEGSRETHDENNGEVTNGVPAAPRADRIFAIEEQRLAAWAEDDWQVGDRLRANYGLRHERSETTTEDFFGDKRRRDASFLLPSMNLVYALQPSTDLRFGVARTLRRPDLRTLSPATESNAGTAADPDRQGNPDQRPESVWGVDTGLYHYFAQQRGQVSLNAFARRFSDKIEDVVRNEAGRFVSIPENVGKGRATGLEATGRVPLDGIGLDAVTLWGNAVYTRSRVDESGGAGRPFLDQPDVVANLGVDYQVPAWRTVFGFAVNWTAPIDQAQRLSGGGRLDSDIDARTRVDLTMRTEISRAAVFSLSLTNLLGETEEREDRVFDAAGSPQSLARTSEPTYRAIYARLNWSF